MRRPVDAKAHVLFMPIPNRKVKIEGMVAVLGPLVSLGLAIAIFLCAAAGFAMRAKRGTSIKSAKCGHRHEGADCTQCDCRANLFVYPSAGSGLP